MDRTNFIGLALASVSLLAIAAPAAAQQPARPSSTTDEKASDVIVVTAQKREENIAEVPLSISVANEAQLERQQVNSIIDLSRIAPTLELTNAPGLSPGGGGQIRGIGTQTFSAGAVGAVGVVVDGVSQGNLNVSELFDIGRVEVLKGPQGTLFGLTTSAGVINIATNEPDFDEFSMRLRTELSKDDTAGSEFGQQVVQGLVNIPIADNAGLRVSGSWNQRQGVVRNRLSGDLADHLTGSARARFMWEPSDQLTVNLIADYTKVDDDERDFFVVYKANAPTQAAVLTPCGITANEENRDVCTVRPGFDHNNSYGGSAQIDYEFAPFTLTSITAGRVQNNEGSKLNIFSLDLNTLEVLPGPTTGTTDLITQEFRIASPNDAKLEYTAGLFYSNSNSNGDPSPALTILKLPPPPFGPGTLNNASIGNGTSIGDFSAAIFGQFTYHVTDQLSVIAGARYTEETLKVTSATAANTAAKSGRTDIDNTSWRLGFQYQFTDDLMGYASASRGYKGPQISLGDVTVPTPPQIIRPEIPTNYEAGVKLVSFGGKVVTDFNVFDMDIQDYQGQTCSVATSGNLVCVPVNIDGVTSKGVEVSAFGQVTDNLTLNTGIVWNQAEYPNGYIGTDGANLGGEQLQSAPELKFTFSGEYSAPFVGDLEGFIAADTVYKSDTKYSAALDPNLTFSEHWILGGRIGVRSADGRWTAALFGRNLTNEHEPIFRVAKNPGETILPQDGNYAQLLTTGSFRLVGISLDVRF